MSFNMRLGIVLGFLCLQTFAPTVFASGQKPLRCRTDADCPPPEKCFPLGGLSAWHVYNKYGVCRCPEGYTRHRCGFCQERSGCGSSCPPPNKCINDTCRCPEELGFIKDKIRGICIDTCPDCSYPKYCKYNNVLNKRDCVCPDGTNITENGCRSSCPEGEEYPCHHSAKCYPTNDGPHCVCPGKTVGDPKNKTGSGCRDLCKPCNGWRKMCVLMKYTSQNGIKLRPKCVCKPSFKKGRNGGCINRCGRNCTYPKKCLLTNGTYSCLCKPGKFNVVPVNGTCVDKCGGVCPPHKECKEWLIGSGQFECRCPCGQKEVGGQCQRICHNCSHPLKTCRLDPSTLPTVSNRCECLEGYKNVVPDAARPDRTYCADIDECHDSKQCYGGKCTNTRGSYFCTCKRGEMAYKMYNRNTSSIIRVCDKYSPWDKNWKPAQI